MSHPNHPAIAHLVRKEAKRLAESMGAARRSRISISRKRPRPANGGEASVNFAKLPKLVRKSE
jgi:hypothetical protein